MNLYEYLAFALWLLAIIAVFVVIGISLRRSRLDYEIEEAARRRWIRQLL